MSGKMQTKVLIEHVSLIGASSIDVYVPITFTINDDATKIGERDARNALLTIRGIHPLLGEALHIELTDTQVSKLSIALEEAATLIASTMVEGKE